MKQWRLRHHVYAADVRGDLVFLDAAGNHYSCLSREDATSAFRALGGNAEPDDSELVTELAEAGLIEQGAPDTSVSLQPDRTAIADYHDYSPPTPRLGFLDFSSMTLAAAEAAFAMNLLRPKSWFARRRIPTDVPLTRVCTLAAKFERMRPLFPRTGRCLPKAMALLSFLRRHDVHADWVFGVQTYPFEAHCWVEYQGVVLSDTLEHVRWYTPIVAR